ncbi:MAG: DegT/DnrJ/EryC1/StrS family aminotransferase [Magnetococcales bacterium]|nr:DegT/DnrJ/EryC1/StrS family aminotransferase [Magnetococcales bacterium]
MKKIRLSKSVVGDEEKRAIARVIDAGYLGMGKEVQLFEEEISKFLSTNNEVICVNTGTAALHLALQAIGVGPGDEVLVPSITYVATFQAVSATGAKPIACDVTEDRVFIDLKDAENRLSLRTKAIMPVHYGSSSEGMDAVYEFASQYGLRVVEDAAHSFGCYRNGIKVGMHENIICFSFDGIKNITSGEGGAIVTSDLDVARKIKDARLLGVEKDTDKRYAGQRSWAFDVSEKGWRYHMSNLMAAIGREQLKKIYMFADIRRRLAQKYLVELQGVPLLRFFDFNYSEIVPHIFPMRVLGGCRDSLIAALNDENIESGIHYQPNHLLELFRSNYNCEISECLGNELISIPLHPEISDCDQERVILCIAEAMNHFKNA